MSVLALPISSLPAMPAFGTRDTSRPDDTAGTPSFSQTLQNAFSQVNDLQNKAADLSVEFAKGETSDIHSVMIAAEQATVALQMTTQVRNKAIDAYQEIMRISM